MNPMQQFAANQMKDQMKDKIMNNLPSSSDKPAIDWTNYNYPPCCKIIHYDPSELQESQTKITNLQFRVVKIFVLICMINFANNLIQAMYHGANFKRVISSILTIVICMPVQLGIFYRLLLGVAFDKNYLSLFYKLQLTVIVLYFLASIMGMGAINGFYRAHICFTKGSMGIPGILCIVEGVFYWFIILISLVVLRKAKLYSNGDDNLIKGGAEELNTEN